MDYITTIRRAVGKQKIVLVYTSVILHDAQGRVLLQERTDLPYWGLPGGVLEWGETLEQCARRELREETGLEAGTLRLVGLYSNPDYDVVYPNGDEAQQFTVCLAGCVAGGRMRVDREEASAQRFIALDALQAIPLPAWYADMIADSRDISKVHVDPLVTRADTSNGEYRNWPPPENLTAVVATVAVLYHPGDGGFRVHSGPVRLGESATGCAFRLASDLLGVAALPERLLGLASGLYGLHTDGHQHQQVVAWFLVRPIHAADGFNSSQTGSRAETVDSESDYPPGLLLALSHASAGYFIQ